MPEIDLSGALELGFHALGDKVEELERFIRSQTYKQQIFAADQAVTTAAGLIANKRIYDIPDGMQFYPSRYMVWSDAHNPSTGGCFQSTSCYGALYHGIPAAANIADWFPPPEGGLGLAATPNILPYYKEFNRFNAPEFQSPDNVSFSLTNGPATVNITVLIYGWLEEIRETKKYPRVARNRRNGRTQLGRKSKVGGRTMNPTDPFEVIG